MLGLLIRTPSTVMTLGFTAWFPLVFASDFNFKPKTMPVWVQSIAEANPVTQMLTAIRALFAGTADLGTVALALALPVAMTAILAPLPLVICRRT